MKSSGRGRVVGAGGCPAISAWIISAAGVKVAGITESTPDDHFTAGPDCRVIESGLGRVGGADGRPLVCAWKLTRVGDVRQSVDNLP